MRIVEVLGSPASGTASSFIELRADSATASSLAGWQLRFGAQAVALSPRQIPGSAEAARGGDPNLVPPHSLALVVDARATDDEIAAAACEAPIATVPAAVPGTGKKRDNILTTLRLQQQRHCIPVFTVGGPTSLGERLGRATDLRLLDGTGTLSDRAQARFGEAPAGVSFERRGLAPVDFVTSPIGATPGTRNFFGSDPLELVPDGRAPIQPYSASPWRVGDMVQEMRRGANAKLALAETATQEDADRLSAEAQEIFAQVRRLHCEEWSGAQDNERCIAALSEGHLLPHNPLVPRFDDLVALAQESVVGSFYQINDPDVITALVAASERGEVRLTSDAGFQNDPHYLEGFARLTEAGIPLRLDTAYTIAAGHPVEIVFEKVTATGAQESVSAVTTRLEMPELRLGERRSLQALGARLEGAEPEGCTAKLDHIFVFASGQVASDTGALTGYKRVRIRDLSPGSETEIVRGIEPTQRLIDADRAPLSHNKFLVVDGEWLWTGSFNPIEDEPARIHADNALIIRSPELAQTHTQEFESMFAGNFGVLKTGSGVGGGEAWVDGAEVEVRFSPGLTQTQIDKRGQALTSGLDACDARLGNGNNVIQERYRSLDPCGGPLDLLLGEVARARSSVYFVTFSLALSQVADLIVERIENGQIDVKGVVDPTVHGRGAPSRIREAGGDVRYTPNSDPACEISPNRFCPTNVNKVWLHHKFVIIDYGTDHPVVITGSHNMSDSAEDQNDEALVVIRDRAVAEAYYRIFREAFDHPQTMQSEAGRPVNQGLPVLALTEVRGSAGPDGAQFVEITNLGEDDASLDDLELWNRTSSYALADAGDELTLGAGERAVVVFGNADDLGIDDGALLVQAEANAPGPFVGLRTALVLRTEDGRWVATYDPYTSAQNLPPGVEAAAPGSAWEWLGFGPEELDALTLELEGRKLPAADGQRFSWDLWRPRGAFSEWLDENDTSPTGLVLMRAASAVWTPSESGTAGQ